MVRCVQLAIPPGMEAVYNPIKDVALMALIRAKWITSNFADKTVVGSFYDIKNATTGVNYKLTWWCKDSLQYFRIEKMKESAKIAKIEGSASS